MIIKYVLEQEFTRVKATNEYLDEPTRQEIINSIGHGEGQGPAPLPPPPVLPGMGSKEGMVRVMGLPTDVSKAEIARFFYGCGEIIESNIRLVVDKDGTMTGDAFVDVKGQGADIGLAVDKSG